MLRDSRSYLNYLLWLASSYSSLARWKDKVLFLSGSDSSTSSLLDLLWRPMGQGGFSLLLDRCGSFHYQWSLHWHHSEQQWKSWLPKRPQVTEPQWEWEKHLSAAQWAVSSGSTQVCHNTLGRDHHGPLWIPVTPYVEGVGTTVLKGLGYLFTAWWSRN